MSLVIAIDVGIKNLGLCVFDFASQRVVFWDNVTLVPGGRYLPAENVQYVRNFMDKYQGFFANAFAVLIERQMRANMRIIESLLQHCTYDKCHIINARSVKMHYGLSTKNYRGNKAKAVEWALGFCAANPTAFADGLNARFQGSKKQDDLADSLLLIMYYLDTFSSQLTSEIGISNFRLEVPSE